jgi:AraC-like DNA-binding protein
MNMSEAARLAYLGFRHILPDPALRPFVRSYWYFRRETPLAVYHEEYMHPRGGFGVAFNFGDHLALDSQPLVDPLFLDGANTLSRKMGFAGRVEMMGVRFHEGGAYPFLAIPLAELRNEVAALDALDRPALIRLHTRLYETDSLPGRIQLMDAWLLGRLSLGKERDALIPASLTMLRRGGGRLSIPTLAENFAISQRQLERLFLRDVGMSPKKYAQLLRVEKARLALKTLTRQNHSRLAAELGYYDQAHFIRDFQAVIGMTPYRYMQRSQARTLTRS